jgi:hypothetical protein
MIFVNIESGILELLNFDPGSLKTKTLKFDAKPFCRKDG